MQFFKNELMRKILSFVLTAGMILSFSACNNLNNNDSSKSSSESSLPNSQNNKNNSSSEENSNDSQSSEKNMTVDDSIRSKLKDANAINSDAVGWIKIPNTKINNEILQSTDNDFYLRRDISKEYNWYGCYYADYECVLKDRNSLKPNTIIYGHNMDDKPSGEKFGQLFNYLNVDFAKKNPYIYVYTPSDKLVFQVFAVYYTDIGFQYHLIDPAKDTAKFNNKMTIKDIADEAKKRSQLVYDVDVNDNDKLLTLSTCTYKYGGEKNEEQRFVVQARLLREGETEQESVSVKKNPKPKEPVFSKEYE